MTALVCRPTVKHLLSGYLPPVPTHQRVVVCYVSSGKTSFSEIAPRCRTIPQIVPRTKEPTGCGRHKRVLGLTERRQKCVTFRGMVDAAVRVGGPLIEYQSSSRFNHLWENHRHFLDFSGPHMVIRRPKWGA